MKSSYSSLRSAIIQRQIPRPVTAVVTGSATGALYAIVPQLGSGATISLISGGPNNLALSGKTISTTLALGNVSQTVVVREQLGLNAFQYPLIITGNASAIPLPTLTATISGTGAVGSTLSASATSVTGNPILSYSWRRGSTEVATSQTYQVLSADGGANLFCVISARNITATVTANSNVISIAAQATNPTFTAAPTISPSPVTVGQTLTVSNGTVSNGTVTSYKWLLNDVDIAGATANTYTPTQAGNYSAKVRATNANGSAEYWTNDVIVAARAGHRYYRMHNLTHDGGTVIINALTLYDASNASIPITGFSASSSLDLGAHPFSALTDGNPNTYWQSNNESTPTLNLDLGSPKVVAKVGVMVQNANTVLYDKLYGFAFEASDDQSTWTVRSNVTLNLQAGVEQIVSVT